MAERVFYKHIGPGGLSYDPASGRIYFSTKEYDAAALSHKMVEVSITEEEWQAIVQYGLDAGYEDIRP